MKALRKLIKKIEKKKKRKDRDRERYRKRRKGLCSIRRISFL